MTIHDELDTMVLEVPIQIRQATARDIRLLEWKGQFTHYRNLFRRSYREQKTGNRHLLVADFRGYPIGRLFIQLHSQNPYIASKGQRGYLYSFYVMDFFRGLQIGSRMMDYAEDLLVQQGIKEVSIAVAKDNDRALKLYQLRGYRIFADDAGQWSYTDHRGRKRQVHEPCWLLEKYFDGDF